MSLGLGLGLGLTRNNDADTALFRGVLARSYLYGRDGSETCTRATQKTCPFTGNLLANNIPCKGFISSASGILLPAVYVGSQFQNLFLNDSAPVTQNITVSTGTYTIRPRTGSGYTVTTSAGTATGTGFGEVAIGSSQTMTITVGGTVVVTISGSPVGAKLTFVAGPIPGPYIPTAGSTVTHNAEQIQWTHRALTSNDERTTIFAPYLNSCRQGILATLYRSSVVNSHIYVENNASSNMRPWRDNTGTVAVGAWSGSNGTTKIFSHRWGAGVQVFSINGVDGAPIATTVTSTPSMSDVGNWSNLGNWNRAVDGVIALFDTPGGLTTRERVVMVRLFANRTITWAA